MSPPPKKRKVEDNRCPHNPVSFEQFQNLIKNLTEICLNVQRDGVAGMGDKTLDECALWYYESFYKDPEVRKKYPYKLMACPMKIRTQVLSMPEPDQTATDEVIVLSSDSEAENTPDLREKKKLDQAVEGVSPPKMGYDSEAENTPDLREKKLDQAVEGVFPPKKGYDSEEENILSLQTDVTVDIGSKGQFMFPVSFETFRECINYKEIIEPILKLAITDESQLANLILRPRNPICEKYFRRYYRSFYIFSDCRLKFEYRFSCPDKRVFEKLTQYAKPLNECAIKTMNQEKTKGQEVTNVDNPEAILKPKSSRQKTFPNGASFEFPVSRETFKRHINGDEIIKSLRVSYGQNDKDKDKELFDQYYCSFYVHKEVRQRFSYSFQITDEELLKKLEEYAVPLNYMARQMLTDQAAQGKENEESSGMGPPAPPKDETLITVLGIAYRFPVSFKTFHKYINYEDLKVGLAKMVVKKKSPEQLAEILGDEGSCLRLLRRYYLSFYTLANFRNKLEYNFNAAPPELFDKLLEWARPINETTVPTQQGVPSADSTPDPDLDATREAELAMKPKINIVTYNLRKNISSRVAPPMKQDVLERDILDSN